MGPCILTHTDTDESLNFESIADAAKHLGCDHRRLSKAISSGRSLLGWTIKKTNVVSRPPNPFALISPTMNGKSFNDFVGKELCYLLTFRKDGNNYIKFGMTANVHKRMTEHMRDFECMQIYTLLVTHKAKRLENAFRTRMRHNGCLVELIIKGEKQTEILTGLTPDEAERELIALYNNQQAQGSGDEGDKEFKQLEMKLRHKQIEVLGMMLDKLIKEELAPEIFQACLRFICDL